MADFGVKIRSQWQDPPSHRGMSGGVKIWLIFGHMPEYGQKQKCPPGPQSSLLYHLVPLWSSASNIRPIIKILYLQQWSITQGAVHTNPLFLSRYRDQRRTWSCKIAQILQTFHLFCIKPKINLLCDIFHYHKTPPRQRFPPKYCSPDSTLCWYHWFQIHNTYKKDGQLKY